MTDEQAYRDGENNAHADWQIALSEVLPDTVEVTPTAVATYIASLIPENAETKELEK